MTANRPASPEILALLAFNTRRRRLELNLSRARLERRCGFEKDFIWAVEHALLNISVDNLYRLADGLKTPAVDLFQDIPRERTQGVPRGKRRR
jgi:transcriptional regulator with XRE-family HTH domain